MCLNVYPYGREKYAGTHMSVFVVFMKGEHDEKLKWPFQGDIIIQLVNQRCDQDHHEMVVSFDESAATSHCADRVYNEERAKSGWGPFNFISQAAVETPTMTTQYLRNDCLKFRIPWVVCIV